MDLIEKEVYKILDKNCNTTNGYKNCIPYNDLTDTAKEISDFIYKEVGKIVLTYNLFERDNA